MRQTNISTIYIDYPEELVWKNDSTVIKLSGSNNIGGKVTITEPAGRNYVLEYHSDQKTLLFYLDDAIKALYDDNLGAWSCTIVGYDNGIPLGSFSFNFNVLNGKSFITRSHGVTSTIYVYDTFELMKLQVFSPQQGIAVCGQQGFNCYYGLNQFNLSTAITTNGEYNLCLRDSNQTPPLVNISGVDPIDPTSSLVHFTVSSPSLINATYGGDVFEPNKVIFPICHKIIYQDHCNDYHFGEISYTDLDGMRRYLGGKVISDSDDVKTESYITSNIDVYKTTPNRFIINRTKTIKLGLFDIEKSAYPYDLLNSDSIQYKGWDGEWYSCTLKTQTLTREDEDTYDFELEIIVSQ